MNNFKQMTSLENVTKAYSGKVGCMCGCNGDYAYAVTPDHDWQGEINLNKVKTRYNKVMKDPNKKVDLDANCVYVENETRTTVIYFK